MHIDQADGQNDAVPTEKKPAPSSRKPPPPRRPRADEPDDESVARRRPPRAGVDDVLTAEVLEQMQLRGGYSRSEMARRIGWNVHSAGRFAQQQGTTTVVDRRRARRRSEAWVRVQPVKPAGS